MIKILNSEAEIEGTYKEIMELTPDVRISDKRKSFDIYHIVKTILRDKNQRNAAIINLGAYEDSSLWVLAKLGYTRLYGLDLREDIYDMPYYTKIKYLTGDMYDTHFPDNMFDVAISLSAIEHGLLSFDKFFSELRRILKNGALCFISTDYNETKIDTEGIKAFGLSWKIFDKAEIMKLIKTAEEYGFYLIDNVDIPKQSGAPHFWNNRNYTAILLGLRLRKDCNKSSLPKSINIVCPADNKHNGIYEYSTILQKRLNEEFGINATIYNKIEDIENENIILYEYVRVLPWPDLDRLPRNNKIIIEMHSMPLVFNPAFYIKKLKSASTFAPTLVLRMSYFLDLIKILAFKIVFDRTEEGESFVKTLNSNFDNKILALARSNHLAEKVGLTKYLLTPLIAYPRKGENTPKNQQLYLGSFGFAYKFKRFDKICKLAKRLKLPLVLILTIPDNDEKDMEECSRVAKKIKDKYEDDLITIKIGYFSYDYICEELSKCSHIIFAQKSKNQTSASMRLASALGKPVIALDSYQAREAQVYRVKSLSEINIEYLKEHNEGIELDDGLLYLVKVLEKYGSP